MKITPLIIALLLLAGCGTQRTPDSFLAGCRENRHNFPRPKDSEAQERVAQGCARMMADRWNRMDIFAQMDETGPGIPYGPGMWGSPGNRSVGRRR